MCDLRVTSMGTSREQILRIKIQEVEDLRLQNSMKLVNEISEAHNKGISLETLSKSFPRMKQRYLEALNVYGRFGLTPQELHESRKIWLDSPYEVTVLWRVKTVSMSLNRLCRGGLAKRKAEGRTYRYFITSSGYNRLTYYSKRAL